MTRHTDEENQSYANDRERLIATVGALLPLPAFQKSWAQEIIKAVESEGFVIVTNEAWDKAWGYDRCVCKPKPNPGQPHSPACRHQSGES